MDAWGWVQFARTRAGVLDGHTGVHRGEPTSSRGSGRARYTPSNSPGESRDQPGSLRGRPYPLERNESGAYPRLFISTHDRQTVFLGVSKAGKHDGKVVLAVSVLYPTIVS